MTAFITRFEAPSRLLFVTLAALAAVFWASTAVAQSTALKQAIAQESANDRALASFYRQTGYEPLWTGKSGKDRSRRRALLAAFEGASDHGLAADRYDVERLEKMLRTARKANDRGRLDVHMSKLFLDYAHAIGSGVTNPRRIDTEINRRPVRRDSVALLDGIRKSNPKKYLAALAPRSAEYRGLMKARIEMQKIAQRGAWGPTVNARKLEPGNSGPAVVALRNRLYRMGHMRRSNSTTYDSKLKEGVQAFQIAHGLAADGVAGAGTLAMINTTPDTRLAQILVAMERERWMNFDRGRRYVEVNIPDYSAKLIDNGRVTFSTRAVLGAAKEDWRTPEFSDTMEFMVVNPSWYVPRSIAVDEYLPMLQENPNAVSHLQLLDENRRIVDRRSVDFASLDEENWPFLMKEPPSMGNALGRVKFMFPNRHNIYLHDTPHKRLFARQTRAFSHGCVRLADPFGFAHALLKPQSSDPEGTFARALNQRKETQINLEYDLPVHLIYRTARVTTKGEMQFRRDIYGRDARIWRALEGAGVTLRAPQS